MDLRRWGISGAAKRLEFCAAAWKRLLRSYSSVMSLFCCDGGGPCAQSSRMRVETNGPAPIVPDSSQPRVNTPLPMLQDWDKLGAREKEVVQEKLESIVFMKLGRNGRLFYRLCTLDKQLTAFSMHIKGAIVERMNLVFSSPMERDEFVTCMLASQRFEKEAQHGILSFLKQNVEFFLFPFFEFSALVSFGASSLNLQARNCSLDEMAAALEAFGTLSVRDLKLLRCCSTALATLCKDELPVLSWLERIRYTINGSLEGTGRVRDPAKS
eukprot:Skav224645  [mRNA]  locus=scaffold4300:28916:35417:+ [translate_table: standard]